jgi:hypothetical protein
VAEVSLSLAHDLRKRAAVSQTTPDENSLSTPKPSDRRRSKRVPISFSIEVSGFDDLGCLFREFTVTNDVSERGCQFDMLREIKRGDVIAIQRVQRNGRRQQESKPLLFEVVWIDASNRGWSVGASKLQSENIWDVAFPPKNHVKSENE